MAQLQGVIDDIKLFGRWPKRNVKASNAEKQLAKRLSYVVDSMPESVLTELQALAPDLPSQIADAVKSLGRMPLNHNTPETQSEAA